MSVKLSLRWKILPIERISIKREGVKGVIHYSARRLKKVKRTGRWTPIETEAADQLARAKRDEFFPYLRGG